MFSYNIVGTTALLLYRTVDIKTSNQPALFYEYAQQYQCRSGHRPRRSQKRHHQTVVHSNMEMLCKRVQSRTCSGYAESSQHSHKKSINALLIQQKLTQAERLQQLNNTAITQMKTLLNSKTMQALN